MLKPHDADPLVIFASEAPWPHRTLGRPDSPIWRPVGLDLLLSEPANHRDPVALPCLTARIAAASVGPLLCAAEGPRTARLERARIPRCDAAGDLDAARAVAWPTLPALRRLGLGAGSPAPSLVVVGERDPYDRFPFFAKSGIWLFRALRLFGYDELSVYLTNALDPDQHARQDRLAELAGVLGVYQPTWLALGSVAQDALRGAGIPAVNAPHPSQHRRFKFKDGPETYARILKEAGVPPGPYLGQDLPRTAPGALDGDPCGALAERFGLPRALKFARGEGHPTHQHHIAAVDVALVEGCRRAYVLGDFTSFRRAAKSVVPDADDRVLAAISKAGRVGRWDVERAEYLAQVRAQAKATAAEAEARSTVKSRRLAWEATELSLGKLVGQLKDPHYVVRAQDVKAVGDFALALSDRGDTTGDATRETLQGLALPELAEKLKETVAGMFGEPEAKHGRSAEVGDAG